MFATFLLLVLLIAVTPVILIFNEPVIFGPVIATAAAAVAMAARSIRPGEADFVRSIVRPFTIAAAIPAGWMILQVLPLGIVGIAHPIWESAGSALGKSIEGGISIDIGATLVSLSRYLSAVAIVIASAAVAIDRQRAEWLLTVLTAAAALIAVLIIIRDFGGFGFLADDGGNSALASAADCAALGVIFAAATANRIWERHETRSKSRGAPVIATAPLLAGSIAALALCALAVAEMQSGPVIFAVAFGLAVQIAVIFIRRFGLGRWGILAVASITFVAAFTIVAVEWSGQRLGPTLAFAARKDAALTSVTARMLAEARWSGTGAGTFAAVVPIYRDIDEAAGASEAPSAAAGIELELGAPMLLVVLVLAGAAAFALLQGALRRGRDSFYPVAGASSLIVLILLSFCNPGIFGAANMILASAMFGLALGQSRSRSR